MQKGKMDRGARPIYNSLSAKDLDLLIELYEENKYMARSRALDRVSLGTPWPPPSAPG
jgi:hypothetical protein